MSAKVEGLRILVVNWNDCSDPHAGGAEIHIHEIFSRLVSAGHQVTLLCNRPPGASRRDNMDGVSIHRVGTRNTFNYHVPFAYWRHFRGKVDVVVDALNKLPLLTPLFCREPVLAIVHHLFGATAFNELTSLAAAYVGFFERWLPLVYRECPFEVISDSTRDDLRSRGIEDERIHTVYCGLDPSLYGAAPVPSAARCERPMLLFLGRVKRYKSVDTILRALPLVRASCPDAHLVVAGSGDDIPRLEQLARSLGLGPNEVHFAGQVSEADKVRLYRQAHAAVMPSPKEGWGLTVVEASACATPVLAADSPGLRESVVDGETGYLYPFGDHERLAELATEVLTAPALREALGTAGVKWASRFSWDRAAEETGALLRGLPAAGVGGP